MDFGSCAVHANRQGLTENPQRHSGWDVFALRVLTRWRATMGTIALKTVHLCAQHASENCSAGRGAG